MIRWLSWLLYYYIRTQYHSICTVLHEPYVPFLFTLSSPLVHIRNGHPSNSGRQIPTLSQSRQRELVRVPTGFEYTTYIYSTWSVHYFPIVIMWHVMWPLMWLPWLCKSILKIEKKEKRKVLVSRFMTVYWSSWLTTTTTQPGPRLKRTY